MYPLPNNNLVLLGNVRIPICIHISAARIKPFSIGVSHEAYLFYYLAMQMFLFPSLMRRHFFNWMK